MAKREQFEYVFKKEEMLRALKDAGDKAPEEANKVLQKMGIDTVYLAQFQTMTQRLTDDVVMKIEESVFPEDVALHEVERKQWLIDHKVYSSVVRCVRVNRNSTTRMQYVLYCPENRLLGIPRTIKRFWNIDIQPIVNPKKKQKDKILLQVEQNEETPFPKWLTIKEEQNGKLPK